MRAPAIALICLLGALAPALAAEPQDTPETRTAAAREYAAVANMPKMLEDAFIAAAQQLPEADRAQFLALTKKYVNPQTLEAISIDVMVRHFTTKELQALARFYGSAEGRSAMDKFGPYMADMLPLVQAEMLRAVQEMQKEMQQQKSQATSGT